MFEETRDYLKKIGMPTGDLVRYALLALSVSRMALHSASKCRP